MIWSIFANVMAETGRNLTDHSKCHLNRMFKSRITITCVSCVKNQPPELQTFGLNQKWNEFSLRQHTQLKGYIEVLINLGLNLFLHERWTLQPTWLSDSLNLKIFISILTILDTIKCVLFQWTLWETAREFFLLLKYFLFLLL